MKLWDKGYSINEQIESFTIGKDQQLDLLLAPYDILGTMAHITMLTSAGILTEDELNALLPCLQQMYNDATEGKFTIDEGIEDVHSQVEMLLTQRLGSIGKKVHLGRSRNDQILVDIKLFTRKQIEIVVGKINALFTALQTRSEQHKDMLMPGYTHLQVAMPSSFGLWFGAYAESLTDDLIVLKSAFDLANENPLGSAAGYGSSAPLKRQETTDLLGFSMLNYNSVYAQMTRGKVERAVANAFATIAETIGRFAMDCCLYNSQNFGFISLPKEITTGSSIMPHKKNPDVFELIRAHCNRINGIPVSLRMITTNLPSGYFRDMQLLKEVYLPMFQEMNDCLDLTLFAVKQMHIMTNLMDDSRYQLAFSVEEVNHRVNQGIPFRDAYKVVGMEIENGEFRYQGHLNHTHEGSIGNLCNNEIKQKMGKTLQSFPFDDINNAIMRLLQK